MLKCSVCGYDNPDDSQTCLNCGSPIERPRLGQAIDDINGEATVLIGQPLVPPANKPSASAVPMAPPPPPPPRPAAPPPMAHGANPNAPPPPPPQPSYAPPPPPPMPSGPPMAHSAAPPPFSGDVDTARKMGYTSLGLGGGSVLTCCAGQVIPGVGCLSIFLIIGGLVVGIIGRNKSGSDDSAKQLNTWGIALNATLLGLFLVLIVIGIVLGAAVGLAAFGAAASGAGN